MIFLFYIHWQFKNYLREYYKNSYVISKLGVSKSGTQKDHYALGKRYSGPKVSWCGGLWFPPVIILICNTDDRLLFIFRQNEYGSMWDMWIDTKCRGGEFPFQIFLNSVFTCGKFSFFVSISWINFNKSFYKYHSNENKSKIQRFISSKE